ncbi:MAG: sensor histidine kinase, partial [Cypionkella sp.]
MTDQTVDGANRPLVELLPQLRDYATVGINLFWQRQMTFSAALLLASFYYSLYYSLLTCLLIVISEAYDFVVFRYVLRAKEITLRQGKQMLALIYVGTVASAGTISFYAIWISVVQS